jgi:hypothetical protein
LAWNQARKTGAVPGLGRALLGNMYQAFPDARARAMIEAARDD